MPFMIVAPSIAHSSSSVFAGSSAASCAWRPVRAAIAAAPMSVVASS